MGPQHAAYSMARSVWRSPSITWAVRPPARSRASSRKSTASTSRSAGDSPGSGASGSSGVRPWRMASTKSAGSNRPLPTSKNSCCADGNRSRLAVLLISCSSGRQPGARQLLVQRLAPVRDGLAAALVDPVPDAALGLVRHHEAGPIGVGRLALRGQDLDLLARLQVVAQRHHLAVGLGADAVVAHLGVDLEGEVDRRRPARQRDEVAAGREDVDLLVVQVEVELADELVGVVGRGRLQEVAHPGVTSPRSGPPPPPAGEPSPPGASLYFQWAATPRSATSCISWVRTWISTGRAPPARSPSCAATGSRWTWGRR